MRALGTFNISVGTSMALEKDAFGELQYTGSFLVNLRTLARNLIASYPKEDNPSTEQMYKDLKSDLMELVKWLDESSKTKVIDLIVYYPTYKSVGSVFSKADLVTEKTMTERILNFNKKIGTLCDRLYKEFPKQIKRNDTSLPQFSGKGLIITHHVVDLVMTNSVTRLKLLESYTGTAKPYTQWYTKLTGGKNLYYIPFNKLTIQVFGDNSTNFYSSKYALKEMICEYAQRWKWTSGTSMSKVKSDINGLPSGINKAGLKLLI